VLQVLLSSFSKFHSPVCSPSSITDTEHMGGKAAVMLRKQWTTLDTETTFGTSCRQAPSGIRPPAPFLDILEN
jgi:hypothetical protein